MKITIPPRPEGTDELLATVKDAADASLKALDETMHPRPSGTVWLVDWGRLSVHDVGLEYSTFGECAVNVYVSDADAGASAFAAAMTRLIKSRLQGIVCGNFAVKVVCEW